MVPVAHGGSATAFKADVDGAHSSPLGNENFAVMNPADRKQFVWMQNAEPISLYCADETDGESLRACEQVKESLLAFEVGGTAVAAGAGRDVRRQRGPDRVDLQAAQGRQVPRRQRPERERRGRVLAPPSGMLRTRCTRATPAPSPTSSLFGAFLNAPPAQ